MLTLAATRADGAITTWAGVEHVGQIAGVMRSAAAPGTDPRLVAWLTVCPDEDAAVVRERARPFIAAYLNVPAYAAFHRWLGNERLLEPVWQAWQAGDRRGALAAVSDELVDQLVVHGPAARCREVLTGYAEAGVTDLALHVQIGTADPVGALRSLAPR
jgi:alkanesulfonate monooxygenase SsuD/methylene tetrahydromethanopterin reductase-like flavin-dependent oxidoreductase (luciferase family)